MAKKFEWQTFKDLQLKYQVYVILLLFLAIVLSSVGLVFLAGMSKEVPPTNLKPEGGSKILPAKIIGGIVCLGLAALSGYYGYTMLIDQKNEKTCNAAFWSKTECVSFPTPTTDSIYEINVSLCKAQTKAQYDGYAGFYTKSNVTNLFDVIYLSGDTESVTATNGSDTLYVKKKQKSDDKEITVTGGGNCNPSPPPPPPECSPGLAKTLGISPAGSGVCLSPCGTGQRRYGDNRTCENEVTSSDFTITSLTGTSTSITFTDGGTGTTKPRSIWLQLYSDSAKTTQIGSILLFTRSGNVWTYNIPSGGTPFANGTYYYKYKMNELTTMLEDPKTGWSTNFTIGAAASKSIGTFTVSETASTITISAFTGSTLVSGDVLTVEVLNSSGTVVSTLSTTAPYTTKTFPHTITTAGTYSVRLKLTNDSLVASSTSTNTFTIGAAAKSLGTIAVTNASSTGFTVNFTGASGLTSSDIISLSLTGGPGIQNKPWASTIIITSSDITGGILGVNTFGYNLDVSVVGSSPLITQRVTGIIILS